MKKKKVILLVIAVVVLILLIIEISPNKTTVESITDSIYLLKKMNLGGLKQSILIRGEKRSNPVIIFLHGGPGFANISYIKKFQKEIEKHYIAVNWDQRGAGKSFSLFIDKNTMTEEQILNDLDQLVDYLCEEFDKEKVYIVGHSWGTILGKDYVQMHPEKVEYYVAIGEYVSSNESDRYSYEYLRKKSEEENDKKTFKDLIEIGRPSFGDNIIKQRKFRKIINEYDGNEIIVNINKEMLKGAITEPEYSIIDLLKLTIGNYYSIYHLFNEYEDRDFREENLEFNVPILFILGKKDLVTNSLLAEEYFEEIESKNKKLIWFEKSGHDPQYEELARFNDILIGLLERTD